MGKNQATAPSLAKASDNPKADKAQKKASKDQAAKPKKEQDVKVAKQQLSTDVMKDGGAKPKKDPTSEIDDIFSAGKLKAQKNAEGKRDAEDSANQPAPDPAPKRPRVDGSKDDIFGETAGKGRKRTEDGFAIYTEDELGLGRKGGDTDLCPFDCDCCF